MALPFVETKQIVECLERQLDDGRVRIIVKSWINLHLPEQVFEVVTNLVQLVPPFHHCADLSTSFTFMSDMTLEDLERSLGEDPSMLRRHHPKAFSVRRTSVALMRPISSQLE